MASIVLASKSPRRQALLEDLGFEFSTQIRETDESYPSGLSPQQAVSHIAENKARAFETESENQIILTADTIVVVDQEILGKPVDRTEALKMLNMLSGRSHEVMTACCLLHKNEFNTFCETTVVHFKPFSSEELDYYIDHYRPYDKAGAYGIQEWIGAIGITGIEGSYTNVVGLPTARLYKELKKIIP